MKTKVILMVARKGMMVGKGSGYKNVIGKDPMVHSQSAKGMKQPQNLKSMSFLQLKNKGINLNPNKDTDKDGVINKKDCKPLNYNAQAERKIFNVKPNVQIIAEWDNTRNGFKHTAYLMINGRQVDEAKVNYLNRTWESYEFETVIKKLLNQNENISETEKKEFLERQGRYIIW